MSRKAGVISINLDAGTAKFMVDMNAAKAKIHEFREHAVSEARATGAGMKVIEGQLLNNKRAAESFLEHILGSGPLLQAAFPIVGAVAFGAVLGELGKKAYEFYREMEDAPQRMARAFRELDAPLRLTNDQLALANDNLENDIAKLEGRHENTLALTLDAARLSADRLADSLDKDLVSLQKVLKEADAGFWQKLFGAAGTETVQKNLFGEHGFGGFRKQIEDITERGTERIHAAKDKGSIEAAQRDLKTELEKAYADNLALYDKFILLLSKKGPTLMGIRDLQGKLIGEDDRESLLQSTRLARQHLLMEKQNVGLETTKTGLEGRKADLEAAKVNAGLDRPFQDRMKALGAEIAGVIAKMEAIGQPEAVQVMAKAFADAQKAIVETNKALDNLHSKLTPAQEAQILLAEETKAGMEAEAAWKTKMAAATTATDDRIRSLNLLTAAIGKGYEATKLANVETRLMQEFGKDLKDPARRADVDARRGALAGEFDAQRAEQSARVVDNLNDQIELERKLADAQMRGAKAVREAALAVKISKMEQVTATKEEIKAVIDLYNAQQATAAMTDLGRIEQRIQATRRLTAAIMGGAEAERKAALENQYAADEFAGRTPEAIANQRESDELEHHRQITAEAMRTGLSYQDQLQRIGEMRAELQKIKVSQGDTLAIEISLRDLENQRLHILAEESLRLGGLRDGVRAFFLEMQTDAKRASEILYEAMNSALDRTSSNLAKLLTGQKTNWAQAFQEIGGQMVESSIKSTLQKGLGALGSKLGLDKFGFDLGGKPDGSSESKALWVRMTAAGTLKPALQGVPGGIDLGGLFGGGSKGGMIFSFLGKLFGGAAGGGESVSSSLSFPTRVAGGEVDRSIAYLVGETGPELFVPESRGSIVPNGGRGGGGATIVNYQIDARGADLGAANRMARAMEAVHRSAVATAVQATHERTKRVPGR